MPTTPNPLSILAKLRNVARKRGLPANLMLRFYAQERFLARLSQSSYRSRFVLKGGLNLYGRYGAAARPTLDIDLAGLHLKHTPKDIKEALENVTTLNLTDGISFENLEAQEIQIEAAYTGIRVLLKAKLGKSQETLQLDISFGNTITPSPVELSFPSLLESAGHSLLAYPLETILAEKLAATVELGEGNTRMKDFYDVFWILNTETLNPATLRRAIERTFAA